MQSYNHNEAIRHFHPESSDWATIVLARRTQASHSCLYLENMRMVHQRRRLKIRSCHLCEHSRTRDRASSLRGVLAQRLTSKSRIAPTAPLLRRRRLHPGPARGRTRTLLKYSPCLTDNIILQLDAIVISVDYAKAPRHPYPHALLQLYQVLRWTLSPAARQQ
jgi:hypothetical protein